ncbi:hypothetical protein F4820DRAFT_436861 [Hypoxylon rubiginosum]|uniref:Uncharacterized protein n=1 Tax=Hypoxylon rubiginosum TaxID=110542 RepID=A0ACB9YMM1_9PEZI|nr:hypothetical protein F4820DRAFT_436861 [Hypoxylon rubiginosum]
MAFSPSFLEILIITCALLVIGQAVTTTQPVDQDVASGIPASMIAPTTPHVPAMTKLLYAAVFIQEINLVFALALGLIIPVAALFFFVVEFPWFRRDLGAYAR